MGYRWHSPPHLLFTFLPQLLLQVSNLKAVLKDNLISLSVDKEPPLPPNQNRIMMSLMPG